ncbi:MAG: thioredoxin-dependent thiol peroxidase [Candidatus Heimdallarchaeota archaeon]|nr:thioredoxin-dependent thiol peroxidase [Candidatus Heimdallarchaeota archaeon]
MNVGDTFPDFSLLDQDEKQISLKDLKGKKFVLFSYPRALTPGCTNEVCSVRDHFSLLKDRGVIPFGISNDPVSKNKKFALKHDLQYSLLCDEENALLEKLGAYGEKKMYGKTSMGTFRYTWIVDENQKIRKIFKKVQTKIHGEEIIEALDELGL